MSELQEGKGNGEQVHTDCRWRKWLWVKQREDKGGGGVHFITCNSTVEIREEVIHHPSDRVTFVIQ